MAQNDRHLLRPQFRRGLVELERFEHDVQVIAVVFNFETLAGIENVFNNEGVQAESGTELFNHINIVNADDIEPGDGRHGAKRRAIIHGCDLCFGHPLGVEIEYGDLGGGAVLFANMHQFARGQARRPRRAFIASVQRHRSPLEIGFLHHNIAIVHPPRSPRGRVRG